MCVVTRDQRLRKRTTPFTVYKLFLYKNGIYEGLYYGTRPASKNRWRSYLVDYSKTQSITFVLYDRSFGYHKTCEGYYAYTTLKAAKEHRDQLNRLGTPNGGKELVIVKFTVPPATNYKLLSDSRIIASRFIDPKRIRITPEKKEKRNKCV